MLEEELILQMREVLSEGFDPAAAVFASAVLELYRTKQSLLERLEEKELEILNLRTCVSDAPVNVSIDVHPG